jgi:hypothetical protein
MALPLLSTAMQKLVVGHDTELSKLLLPVSICAGVVQVVPFQEMALPLLSTAMQKLVVGHDTESMPLLATCEPDDHVALIKESALPLLSTAMQNVVVGHDTELISPLNSTGEGDDHETPL